MSETELKCEDNDNSSNNDNSDNDDYDNNDDDEYYECIMDCGKRGIHEGPDNEMYCEDCAESQNIFNTD